jgi:hypothetical protein
MELKRLIEERDEWVGRNFGHSDGPGDSIIGVMEELGELCHAHLKAKQNIRGTQEEHKAAGQDAVADLTIYLWGVISHYGGENLGEFIMHMQDVDVPWASEPEEALFELGASVGRLAAYHVTPERYPIGNTADLCAYVFEHTANYATLRGWDFRQLVKDTWAKVKARDWVTDPQGGGQD